LTPRSAPIRHETPSALIEFEGPTPVTIYVHEEGVQQIVLLTEAAK
jgi:hypothetical protein